MYSRVTCSVRLMYNISYLLNVVNAHIMAISANLGVSDKPQAQRKGKGEVGIDTADN